MFGGRKDIENLRIWGVQNYENLGDQKRIVI